MRLDRNTNPSGKGKYAVINLRKIPGDPRNAQELAEAILANPECVEFGIAGSPDEFWLLKLKDEHAEAALYAYAGHALPKDPEYAAEVAGLARCAGRNSLFCKTPD